MTFYSAHAAADDSPRTPKYSAEVLTASLGAQKERMQQERAELQDMIEELIRMKNGNAQPPTDTDVHPQLSDEGLEVEDTASVPPSPF